MIKKLLSNVIAHKIVLKTGERIREEAEGTREEDHKGIG